MKPLFCDVSLNDFTMNVGSLKKILDKHKKNVQMIVPTHVFGNLCDLGKIIEIARKRKIFVLEDAAQSLGSKINDKRTGSIGDASIVSFGHTKILDCGGGGGILTNDSKLYNKVRKLYRKIPKKLKNSNKLTDLSSEFEHNPNILRYLNLFLIIFTTSIRLGFFSEQ